MICQQHLVPSSQVIHFLSAEILSSPQSPFAIWAYCWTATCPRRLTCLGMYQLFCSSATDTQHPSFRQSASFTVSRQLVGAVALRLRQCKPRRNISTLAGSSAVRTARLVCNGRKYDHITPLLLRVPGRIALNAFRLAVLMFRSELTVTFYDP